MGLLTLIGLVVLLWYLTKRKSGPSGIVQTNELEQRNIEWAIFIASYKSKTKNKSQKDLIETMLSDIKAKGLPVEKYPSYTSLTGDLSDTKDSGPTLETSMFPQQNLPPGVSASNAQTIKQKADSIPLDNATLLLYFGAFLFVASVGLFVAFGQANGILRTSAVALVTLVMYSGGIWLFQNKPKLKPAGLAFAGIGIATMPLVGLAAYNYVLVDQAREIWFLTSVLSMFLYAHALIKLRKPLINYIFIFTFLSLFESGISITNAPIYYFGWAMALVGICFQLLSKWKGFWPELQESSRNSGQLFLPLAILVSAVLVQQQGFGQLGVSLLLAGLYYALEAWRTSDTYRDNNFLVSHIAILAGITCSAYSITGSTATTAVILVILNFVQITGLWILKSTTAIGKNFANVLFLSAGASIVFALGNPSLVFGTVVATVVIGLIVWLRQNRADAYGITIVAWMSLPIIFGQYVANPRLDIKQQTGLLLAALLVQLAVMLTHGFNDKHSDWAVTARAMYLISSLLVLVSAILVGPSITFQVSIVIAITTIVLAYVDDKKSWSTVGGILITAPLITAWPQSGLFLVSLVVSLAYNIGLTLWTRQDTNRWISTCLWLLLPVGFGHIGLIASWQIESYAWAYIVAMCGLILSRAIARGSVFLSTHIPMTSYVKSASQSYVVGYIFAALLAIVLSLISENSQIHTTLICLVLLSIVIFLSRYIEKRTDILVTIPILAQFTAWSAIRPSPETGLHSFLLISTGLSIVGYLVVRLLFLDKKTYQKYKSVLIASLWCAFIAPVSIMFVGATIWPMPIGLMIAGYLLYDYLRDTSQDNREFAGGVMVAGFMWLLYFAGLREFQAYSHITATLFAGYAYWRTKRGETSNADNYLMLMLASATIPLIFQAVAGESGGLYGWWLLLEQIGFMLLGMAIHKKIVINWGLYVALGAVLYQLRNLGWAALIVLASFLIGLAVYQLQKHTDKN